MNEYNEQYKSIKRELIKNFIISYKKEPNQKEYEQIKKMVITIMAFKQALKEIKKQ